MASGAMKQREWLVENEKSKALNVLKKVKRPLTAPDLAKFRKPSYHERTPYREAQIPFALERHHKPTVHLPDTPSPQETQMSKNTAPYPAYARSTTDHHTPSPCISI